MGIPAKSRGADRLRPTPWDSVVIAAVIAAAVLLLLALRPAGGGDLRALVTLDGAVIAEYDLSSLSQPLQLSVDCPYPLVIEAEQGRIHISESECPGGDCVHTGWVSRAGGQIVCLPNRLVISLSAPAAAEDGVDAVTG